MTTDLECSCGHRWQVGGPVATVPRACPVCGKEWTVSSAPPGAESGSRATVSFDTDQPGDGTPSVRSPGDGETLPFENKKAEATPGAVPGYEILSVLGRGGMGVVYKARQTKLDRIVALKMILGGDHADEHQSSRFRTEAEAIARLQHPNIVQVFEIDDHDGRPFLALEFCPKGNLAQSLGGNPLPPLPAAALAEKLARAVHAAHERRVVHRDLKPANILLSAEGEPKITDFGLAKKLDDIGQTQSGVVMGTPSYMAPEQARGAVQSVGPAADIYALGSILYELLTGRPPFKGATTFDTILQVLHQEPVPPGRLLPNLHQDLETICLKCLQKAPAARYDSALALADDLGRFRRGEPILARPIGRIPRVWRWCRRNPLVASLLAGFIFSLLAGTTAATYFAIAAGIRAEETLEEKKRADIQTLRAKDNARKAAENEEKAQASAALARQEQLRARAEEAEARRSSYVNAVHLAGQALDAGDLEEAKNLLQAVRPKGDEADWRGFEWYHLWRQCHRQHVELGPFQGSVRALAVTPDGKTLLVAGGQDSQGRVSFLDLETRTPAGALKGLRSMVNAVAISKDGRLLATAEGALRQPGQIKIWDLPGRKLLHSFGSSTDSYTSLAFLPDGTLLSGSARLEESRGSPGDRYFFVKNTPRTGGVKLWNPSKGAEIATLPGDTGNVFGVAASPDGTLIAAGNAAGVVTLWDPATRLPAHVLRTGSTRIWAIAFSPDGKWLATGAGSWEEPGQAKLWRLSGTGGQAPTEHQTFHVLHGGVVSLAFAPDGNRLAVGSWDRTIRFWEPASGLHLATIAGHHDYVWALTFTPNGKHLVSGGWDRSEGEIKLWDTALLPQIVTTTYFGNPGYYVQQARSGRLLALVEKGGRAVRLFDAQTGKPHNDWRGTLPGNSGIRCVALSPDGTHVAAGGFATTTRLWSVDSGTLIGEFKTLSIPFLAFAPDGKTLGIACDDGTVRLVDTATGKERLVLKGHTDVVWSLSFSSDGRRLATGSWDRTAKVWDTERGTLLATLKGNKDVIWRLHFIHQGAFLVAATLHTKGMNAVSLWDGRPEEALADPIPSEDPEGYLIASFAYHSQGRQADADRAFDAAEVLLKDVALPGKDLTAFLSSLPASAYAKLKTAREYLEQEPLLSVQGMLAEMDPLDVVQSKSRHRTFMVELKAGRLYAVRLDSRRFDAFLRIEDDKGTNLAMDDDSGGGTNSLLHFRPTRDGAFRLIATSFTPGLGGFTLSVRELSKRR